MERHHLLAAPIVVILAFALAQGSAFAVQVRYVDAAEQSYHMGIQASQYIYPVQDTQLDKVESITHMTADAQYQAENGIDWPYGANPEGFAATVIAGDYTEYDYKNLTTGIGTYQNFSVSSVGGDTFSWAYNSVEKHRQQIVGFTSGWEVTNAEKHYGNSVDPTLSNQCAWQALGYKMDNLNWTSPVVWVEWNTTDLYYHNVFATNPTTVHSTHKN